MILTIETTSDLGSTIALHCTKPVSGHSRTLSLPRAPALAFLRDWVLLGQPLIEADTSGTMVRMLDGDAYDFGGIEDA